MVMPLHWGIVIVIFAVQLVMGLRVRNKWVRLIPVYLTGGFELTCVVCYFLRNHSFSAFILGYIGCYWCAAAVLAWGICAIVKRIQKRRK